MHLERASRANGDAHGTDRNWNRERKIRKLALISDVHIFDAVGVRDEPVAQFLNLRALGLLNILFLRGPDKFSERVLLAAMRDMREVEGVDHLILAGDITNLALECEYAKALQAFELFCGGDASRITAVPGNHDIYNKYEASRTPTLFAQYFGQYAHSDVVHPRHLPHASSDDADAWNGSRWADFHRGGRRGRRWRRQRQETCLQETMEAAAASASSAAAVLTADADATATARNGDRRDRVSARESVPGDDYPFVQLRGDVLLVGLNTAIPGTAQGEVGAWQWRAAWEMMRSARCRELCSRAKLRVLVLHHPAQNPDVRGLPWIRDLGHDLKDWVDVAPFSQEFGIDVVVHGHNHVPYIGWLAGARDTLVVEGGSGTLLDTKRPDRMARYTVFELGDHGELERIYARVWNYDQYGSGAEMDARDGAVQPDWFRTEHIAVPPKPDEDVVLHSAGLRKRTLFGGLPF
ncbi:hypothetical protein CDCA_CDCA08G2446 [Cyanidium caldarium]|uniref:Calcineurin-like phosphoesterase domain-containing protein n=1 Tax=Cyanidium caldarium TaxID=2771 RepID=A0AAV9IW82_CYACA|nr:hypothetical protein CDCA_CDCA08G2446 [Cyanidium caldarium]